MSVPATIHPTTFLRLVQLRNTAHQEPSVLTVGMPPQTNLDLGRMVVGGRKIPFRFEHRQIVRMHEFEQAFGGHRHRRVNADIVDGALVPVVERQIGACDPDALRQRVHQRTKAQLAAALERLAIALTQQRGLPLDHLLFLVQLDEDRHLRAQNFRIERLKQKIDGAALVAAHHVGVANRHSGQKDNRNSRGAFALTDHFGGAQPVHPRHPHVHQDDGELLVFEFLKCFFARGGAHQALIERIEDCLERQ